MIENSGGLFVFSWLGKGFSMEDIEKRISVVIEGGMIRMYCIVFWVSEGFNRKERRSYASGERN